MQTKVKNSKKLKISDMNKIEQFEHFQKFTNRMKTILDKKGDDYANEDRLSNFKSTAQITKSTPAQVILNLIGIKLARLGELLNLRGVPKNEPVSDSIVDMANYLVLLDAYLNEKNKDIPEPPKVRQTREII